MSNKVIRMINSYTKKRETEKAQMRGENRVSRKRTIVFGSILLAVAGLLLIVALHQQSQNNALGEEVADREEALEEKVAERKDLEQRVKQLNDEDYIMRIARSEFYLSEEDEIIFNFQEGEESGQESESSPDSNNSEE